VSHARPDVPPPPSVTTGAAIDARKLALARSFRRQPTPAEAAAWLLLRGRRILGLKFRRQQVVAGFIVDFY
jgi:very-short-patch-repair endonuclease